MKKYANPRSWLPTGTAGDKIWVRVALRVCDCRLGLGSFRRGAPVIPNAAAAL